MLAGVLVLCCFALLGARGAGARRRALCPRRLRAPRAMPPRAQLGRATLPWPAAAGDHRAAGARRAARHARRAGCWPAAPTSGASTRSAWRSARRCSWRSPAACSPPSPRMPMAWLSIRAPGRLQRAARRLQLLSSARCPASSWRWRWSRSPCASPCRSTRRSCTILLAYALMFLPRALISLRASIAQAPVELERAAAQPRPFAAPGAVVGHHAPGGARRRRRHGAGRARHHQRAHRHPDAGAERHAHAGDGVLVAAAARSTMPPRRPMRLMMVLLSLPLTWLLYVQSKRMAGR